MLDDVEVVYAKLIAVTDELDGFKSAVSDIDAPGEVGCHMLYL